MKRIQSQSIQEFQLEKILSLDQFQLLYQIYLKIRLSMLQVDIYILFQLIQRKNLSFLFQVLWSFLMSKMKNQIERALFSLILIVQNMNLQNQSIEKELQKNFIYNDSTNIEAEFEAFVKELNLTGEEILVISIGIKNSEYINLEKLENNC